MCGIAGIIWSSEKQQAGSELIRQMTDAIAHRGPNAAGHWTEGPVALGHRRLSIIDLSTGANQPLWDASGRYAIVFNGEIYNFSDIRKELDGYPFRTNGDTEVILAAWQRWGEDCLHRFFGMFAFAIWDKQEQELFMTRDRMGIKPFYYFHDEEKFLFGSEIRALLASGQVPRQIDPRGLQDYLTYQTVHAPRSLVQQVFQLRPGECAILRAGRLNIKTWWKLAPDEKREMSGNYETIKKDVRELLLRAVERRLVSDVPLGAFLSGGIDSSAVVALMAETAGRQVDTFSVVFEEARYDESYYAGLVARRFNTCHHPLLLKPEDFLNALPDALRAMDAPSGDGVNTFVVSKVTKEAGVTVALSGLGGDELFAGYSHFLYFLKLNKAKLFWHLPRWLRLGGVMAGSQVMKSHQKGRLLEIAGAGGPEIESVYPAMRKLLSKGELDRVAGRDKGRGHNGKYPDAVQSLLARDAAIHRLPLLSQLSVADISTYTQNVLLKDTDQMSMAHALEVRVPFFDHALVEYVLQIPDEFKYPDYPKKLLVESLHPLLPDEVVFREKKGFDLPWKIWLKKDLKKFCEERLASLAARDILDEGFISGLWQGFLSGKNDNLWSRVWIFVVLEDWLQRNIDVAKT
jgi:asparagine synthase (glutamine-hydrolysing)